MTIRDTFKICDFEPFSITSGKGFEIPTSNAADSRTSPATNFFIKRKYKLEHGKDVDEFMDAVHVFISWIYENRYRKRTFNFVPDDILGDLHPQILSALLRSYAKRTRPRIQPQPQVMIRAKWIAIDLDQNRAKVDEIYRKKMWTLDLPLPDFAGVEVDHIMRLVVDRTHVEYTVAIPLPPIVIPEQPTSYLHM